MGGVVLSENNATLSEDWIGFSDRSSVAKMIDIHTQFYFSNFSATNEWIFIKFET